MKKEMSSIKTSLPSDVQNKEVQYYLHGVFKDGNKLLVMLLIISSVKWDGNCHMGREILRKVKEIFTDFCSSQILIVNTSKVRHWTAANPPHSATLVSWWTNPVKNISLFSFYSH